MTARELFAVLIKMAGIFLLKDSIIALTSIVPMFFEVFNDAGEFVFSVLIIPIIFIGIYGWMIYIMLFRTGLVIDRLKLTDGFTQEPFSFNIHRSVVLSISFIVSGIIILVNIVPFFIKEVIAFFQSRKPGELFNIEEPFRPSYIILYGAEVIIAIILIVYQRTIVNFIESMRKK